MRTNEEYRVAETLISELEKTINLQAIALEIAHKATADAREIMAVELVMAIAEMDNPPHSDTAGGEFYQLKGRGQCIELIRTNYLPQPIASNDG